MFLFYLSKTCFGYFLDMPCFGISSEHKAGCKISGSGVQFTLESFRQTLQSPHKFSHENKIFLIWHRVPLSHLKPLLDPPLELDKNVYVKISCLWRDKG